MKTKKDIIKIALKIFLIKGYELTTISDIISESKLSKGGLYYHFKNKEEIFSKSINYLFQEIDKRKLNIYENITNIDDLLNMFLNLFMTKLSKILGNITNSNKITVDNFYQLITEASLKFPFIAKKYNEFQRSNQKLLYDLLLIFQQKKEIKSECDCKLFSLMVSLLTEGALLNNFATKEVNNRENYEKIFHYIRNELLNENINQNIGVKK